MEDLFPVLIFILIGLISAASKKKKQQASSSWPQTDTAHKAEAPQPQSPAQPTVLPPRTASSALEHPMAPTVHPHLQPDCAPHDAPGSLGVTSLEGKDPCHEAQLTHPRTVDASAPEASGLTFDWSGDSLVKAIVMQEILTRPAARRQAR